MKYVMINLLDPNDSFEIEAETDTDAAFKALEELGWGITSHEDDGDDVAFMLAPPDL